MDEQMGYLAGPVNTLADFQVEYNGLLMGPGTNYDVPPTWHFMDMAPVKTMDQARVWADGSWSGPDYADVLVLEMPVTVAASDAVTFNTAVQSLQAVLNPQTSTAGLWFKLPNQAVRGISAKTNRRVLPIDLGWPRISEGAIQWRCPDSNWQSVPRTSNVLGSAAALNSGMSFPLFETALGVAYQPPTVNALDFGSVVSSGSSATLTNAGNSPAYPVVNVYGPTTGAVSLVLDGNLVTYSQAIPSGSTLTVDYRTGLASLNGVDRTYALSSRQFTSVTSSSIFLYSSTNGGTATVTTADVWR
jgi:hypothetical protein